MKLLNLFKNESSCIFCQTGGREYICEKCRKKLDSYHIFRPNYTIKNNTYIFFMPFLGDFKNLVYNYKYKGYGRGLNYLGYEVLTHYLQGVGSIPNFITYIETSNLKKKIRNRNFLKEISQYIGTSLGIDSRELIKVEKDSIPLAQISGSKRKININNKFSLREEVLLEYKDLRRILIIDDIFTTGGTSREVLKLFEKWEIEIHFLCLSRREYLDVKSRRNHESNLKK